MRYGYRMIRVLSNRERWQVGKDLVYRLCKEEEMGLRKRPVGKRRAAVQRKERMHQTGPNQVWAMDFVSDHVPSGVLPTETDSTLRVDWTPTDATSGAVLTSEDDLVTSQSPGFEFQPSSFASSIGFAIQGRLYRLFGTASTDIGSATTSLQVRGALAPNVYLSWRAQSIKPQKGFDSTSGVWMYS